MSLDPAEVHPAVEEIEGFVLGRRTSGAGRQVLRHLLAECEPCRATAGDLWEAAARAARLTDEPAEGTAPLERQQPVPADYDLSMSRVFQQILHAQASLQQERTAAEDLLLELMSLPRDRRREAVESDSRFRSWGLCELLLTRSQKGRYTAEQQGAELAEAAVDVAERLDPATYDPALLEDLRARTWAFLANARRVLSDLRGAERGFEQAEWHLARGTGDRLERARILDLKASLRTYQGRRQEALRLLDRAIVIYRRAEQRHAHGRAVLNKAHVNIWEGNHETAIALLRQGLELIERDREPNLALTGYHNLAYVLNDLGRHEEAAQIVAASRPLYLQAGNLVQLQCLEARIALGKGELERAETLLQEVRGAFGDKGMAYDAALASLDLAEVYARQGRSAELRELGQEMLSIFQSRELHREAIAALILLQKAAEAQSVTVTLVQELAGRVQRIRRQAAVVPSL